eukprot:GHVT01007377.1.p1 GENE.GHVT01007377.1~~GHVT01007377.1.p1  ORF type:complete len:179 (+),score=21.54 GHVT01007377.1:317-853(+)
MAAVPARSSALEDALVNSLREKEAAVDAEIKALDKTVERAAEYEGADELEEIRRRRIEEMKREKNRNANCQPYEEIHDQKEFFNAVKECSKLVCHFYRPTTWRCQLVDKHLQQLSHRHGDIRFLKINAEKAPFLCDRLKVWCMPTVSQARTLVQVAGVHQPSTGAHRLSSLVKASDVH